jgi:Tol biopolymer transport system component
LLSTWPGGHTRNALAPRWKIVFERLTDPAGGDGLQIATSVRQRRPFWVARPLRSTESYEHPAWSPAGHYVAFDGDRPDDLYVVGADGRGLKRIASGELDSFRWSPDETLIAFATDCGEDCAHGHIDVVGRDSRNRRVVVRPNGLASGAGIQVYDWSPAGDRLLYRVHDRGRYRLSSVELERPRPRLLADSRKQGGLAAASWSSSGRLIAYTRNCGFDRWGTYCDLGVMNADGTAKRVLHRKDRRTLGNALDGTAPVWIPGTNRLVFSLRGTNDEDEVRVLDVLTRQSTTVSTEGWEYIRVAPDGETLAGVSRSVVLTRPDGTVVARDKLPFNPYDHPDIDLWIG